ncbi:hypothetical protein NCG97_03280 [Streptomyces lydicamycinicus]|uniref:hypothetical protein n=1 Tax=Streptomyces lydicamycinicus TaxID=1546107 RepID=UPI00203554BD|nr:hypothetical protein [Streptomyces lydicamycinicus]URZ99921.1 hypothetical protein NCG97_03280 [Streptomyces lydicamycinicus]
MVLTVAITTLLLSYLAVVPSLLALRLRHREVPRPYQVPFGTRGFTVATLLVYGWIVLGSWVALFPGTLERLFGLLYDFRAVWGVSRLSFEAFTLGTVALLLAVAVAGYLTQRRRTRPRNEERATGPAR